MLLTTLAIAAALQGAQGQDFRWSGRLADGKTLEIMGVNGEIRASAAGGATAEVTASKSGRGDHEAVRIKVEETDEGVTICAIYPNQVGDSCHDRETRKNQRRNNNDNNVEVDFVVRVPEGVRFVGRTVNGSVEATGLTADAEGMATRLLGGAGAVRSTGVTVAGADGSLYAAVPPSRRTARTA